MLLLLLVTYLLAALMTAWFFKVSKLGERLPSPVPGRGFMIAGVVLSLPALVTTPLLASKVGNWGLLLTVVLSNLALVLLIIGAVTAVLAARPKAVKNEHTS
jgi:hypothetical protein